MGGGIGTGIDVVLQGLGLAQQYQANEQEGVAKDKELADNQRIAQAAAADALVRGDREASLLRMKGTQQQGATRAAYSASGVDTSVGTPLQAAGQNAYFSELDAKQAENNAAREAWGFKNFGTKYQQQAALEAARTGNKQAATLLGGSRQLISSATKGFKEKDQGYSDEGW